MKRTILLICAFQIITTLSASESGAQKCSTYYTLSKDKTKLTWVHICTPNIKHRMFTGEKLIIIKKWSEMTDGSFIAKGSDIDIPNDTGIERPKRTYVGQVTCNAELNKVNISLAYTNTHGNRMKYKRNGVYELVYKDSPNQKMHQD